MTPLARQDEARARVGDALCDHCKLPVPAGQIVLGAPQQFCCAGCRAVFEAVGACGLENYYELRDAASATLVPAHPGGSSFDVFDSPAFHDLYVSSHGEHVRSADLYLQGVTCAACIWLLERLPGVHEGVLESRLSLARSTLRVTWDGRSTSLARIARTLDRFGHTPHPAKGGARESHYRREFRSRVAKLGVAGAIAGNLMLLSAGLYAGWAGGMEGPYAQMLRWVSLLLGATTLAWPGAEFFRSAWAAVRVRAVNLDVPIVIALLAGGVAGAVNVVLDRGEIYFDSLGTLVFLLLIGRLLQFRQQRQSADAVELLFSLAPSACRIVSADGSISEAPVESLRTGDMVEVLPGDLIPADGVVEAGRSTADEALLTGESAPRAISPGHSVFGGSQNGASPLRVRVTQVGEASRVGRLMSLLERGQSEKPHIVRFSDRVGAAFTVAVTVFGLVTFAFWTRTGLSAALDHAIALLIVTCPCVLGLATPMTISVAIGQLARRDVLVKSGEALERLAAGGSLLLDKTGTLTEGKLRVVAFEGDSDVRGTLAQLERSSVHPVARAIVAAFEHLEPPAEFCGQLVEVEEHHDGGISGQIGSHLIRAGSPSYMARHDLLGLAPAPGMEQTTVVVAIDGRCRAHVTLSDELRPDAVQSVCALKGLGFAPEIWSGDARGVVRGVAERLGLPADVAHGTALPEEKFAAVRSRPRSVMVGDGVNDAAALAAAGVGIAVHGGSEASLAAADVYVARPGLSPIVDLVRTSRRMMCVIRGNFCVSLAYNLLAGGLAATGHMNPLIAAILMPLSSATVLSVAVTLMGRPPKERL